MIELVPGRVSLAQLERFYRGESRVRLAEGTRAAVDRAAAVVAEVAGTSAAVYGINTGFGKLSQTRIECADRLRLQRNLILSHCCGVGPALPEPVVRLMILLKVISLARGASGVRWQLIELLLQLLERNVVPQIPAQGSVGASGDLAPLAHLVAVLIGEGEAAVEQRVLPAREALAEVGLQPLELGLKEGLGMINGTQCSTALALAALFETRRLLQSALITGALSTDAAMGSTVPFRDEIHQLRGQLGQIEAAACLRGLMADSGIRESHRTGDSRVQDPYCLRCQPQVMGACIDLWRSAGATLVIEANAVTDNPVVVVATHEVLSGGNFHAEGVAFAADQLALVLAEIGSLAQRRIAMLVDPALNYGLPAFLSPNPGVNSGFMIAEVTAAALMAENKQRATPCSTDSTPTSANQEDHVSMATHAARRLLDMLENLSSILGIEFLVAAQGVELRRPLDTSPILRRVHGCLRERVAVLAADRFLAPDLRQAKDLVSLGELVRAARLADALPYDYEFEAPHE
jgi:histidine ammonia-lyase